jgi:hypothetical protein
MSRIPRELNFDPPYDIKLKGMLSFKDFASAEGTIRKLDQLRHQFLAVDDDKGIEYCREVALLGRRRAESISRNRRVAEHVRRHKAEIAYWFGLWLESPDLFESWLEMRKRAPEFIELRNAGE